MGHIAKYSTNSCTNSYLIYSYHPSNYVLKKNFKNIIAKYLYNLIKYINKMPPYVNSHTLGVVSLQLRYHTIFEQEI